MKTKSQSFLNFLEMIKQHSIQGILLLMLVLTLFSCRKNEDSTPKPKVFPEENPLQAYLTKSGFNEKVGNNINENYFEFGYRFVPKVTGKINAVTFKIPDNATNTRVTLWDVDTKTPIKTIIIPNNTAHEEVRTNIEPVALVANKEYLISYNGNDYYYRNKTNDVATSYPIDAGNISITGFQWLKEASQTYPANSINTFYAGDLSIVFQQTK